jgi:hypothetical protein
MDRGCFYCRRRFRLKTETFVVCGTCYGFNACRECWATKGNAKGWTREVLEARQLRLLKEDRNRDSDSEPMWEGLENHLFSTKHANPDPLKGESDFYECTSSWWDSDHEEDEEDAEQPAPVAATAQSSPAAQSQKKRNVSFAAEEEPARPAKSAKTTATQAPGAPASSAQSKEERKSDVDEESDEDEDE